MDDEVIRRAPFAGALNFRDIGGYPATGGMTRWRTVYRSDSLHYLTGADLATFDALGIKAVYDLRRPGEIARFPGPRGHMLAGSAPAFGSLLARLAENASLPAVVHCLGGKDRTGMVIALLLTALEVDRSTVLDDYELTSRCHASRVPEVVEAFTRLGIGGPAAQALMSTPRWAMARALRELDQAHGGVRKYLLGAGGMSPQTLSTLRETLVS